MVHRFRFYGRRAARTMPGPGRGAFHAHPDRPHRAGRARLCRLPDLPQRGGPRASRRPPARRPTPPRKRRARPRPRRARRRKRRARSPARPPAKPARSCARPARRCSRPARRLRSPSAGSTSVPAQGLRRPDRRRPGERPRPGFCTGRPAQPRADPRQARRARGHRRAAPGSRPRPARECGQRRVARPQGPLRPHGHHEGGQTLKPTLDAIIARLEGWAKAPA